MDFLNSNSNEAHLSSTYINNTLEPINETHNLEGFNIIDNNFLFNQKDMELFKLIEKQPKINSNEDNEKKDFIEYDENYLIFEEKPKEKKPNEKKPNSTKIKEQKIEKSVKTKKKCGRKRERSNDENAKEHDKFSDDNIKRKCKHLVLKNAMIFINQKIYDIYEGKIGNGIFKKELKTINHQQKKDASVNFNKDFLNKTLGEIFSDNISSRYTNVPLIYNQKLISSLINEKDEKKRQYFTNLFSITFLGCLKHFRGDIKLNELEGLKCFESLKENIKSKYNEEGEDYVQSLEYYLKNFEIIVGNKKPRAKRIEK